MAAVSFQQFKDLITKVCVIEAEATEIDSILVLDRNKKALVWIDYGLSHIFEYSNLALRMKIHIAKSGCSYPLW